MIFYVKMLSGKQFGPFDMPGDTWLRDVKSEIERQTGLPATEQRLIYTGRELENQRTLNDYNIQENEVLYLVSRLSGGRLR